MKRKGERVWSKCACTRDASLLLWPFYRFPSRQSPWRPSPCRWADSAPTGRSQEGSTGTHHTLNASECSSPFPRHTLGEKLLWSHSRKRQSRVRDKRKKRRTGSDEIRWKVPPFTAQQRHMIREIHRTGVKWLPAANQATRRLTSNQSQQFNQRENSTLSLFSSIFTLYTSKSIVSC